MKNIKRVYISGPMTGLLFDNHKDFIKAQAHYESEGLQVVNPHELAKDLRCVYSNNKLTPPDEATLMGYDLGAMSRCNAIVLLPGWEKSKGCKHEIAFAVDYGIPVFKAFTNEELFFEVKIKLLKYEPFTIS